MKERKGIILAGGTGTRLFPITQAVSKQLMPVYDKPMIYYPLATLMQIGIREVLIITTPHDNEQFVHLLQDGSQFGIRIEYAIQDKPEGLAQALTIAEKFLDGAPSALILGDNLFYGGKNMTARLERANARTSGATIFGYHVSNPKEYGVVHSDENGKVLSLEEKPQKPKSNYAIPGLYFYDEHAPKHAHALKPSPRGELEITDLNRTYLEREELHVEYMGRGVAWLDTGTHQSLLDAGSFVSTLEKRQGLAIACLEEIAFHNGLITKEDIKACLKRLGKSSYTKYLKALIK